MCRARGGCGCDSGEVVRVGFAGTNEREYASIGKAMVDAGIMTKEEASLQTIRAYLNAHPDEIDSTGCIATRATCSSRKRRPIRMSGPVGAFSVPLTPGRSIAVDPAFVALGLPVWLDTTEPVTNAPLRRLVVAQDKGSAIKGPGRIDLFWGAGDQAEAMAGPMRQQGTYWVIVPRAVGERWLAAGGLLSMGQRQQVGLFVTCLVDLYRPTVGFAAIALIERSGSYTVVVPEAQTCCGQPGYNSGDKQSALAIARQVVAAFEGFDYVVAPSGSCGGMIKTHYPELLAGDPAFAARARDAGRQDLRADAVPARRGEAGTASRRRSRSRSPITIPARPCASCRSSASRANCWRKVGGLSFKELPNGEPCCGFGGTFCVKFPDISNRMVEDKVANIEATGADVVLAADMGCLLNIAGKLKRAGSKVEARHVAEVLAGMADDAAIGEGQ